MNMPPVFKNAADYRKLTSCLMHVILTCDEETGDDGMCDCARAVYEELCGAHANGLREAYEPLCEAVAAPDVELLTVRVSSLIMRFVKHANKIDPLHEEREKFETELREADS